MTRTALVTGGTRGIGRATVIALRQAGFEVAATYTAHDAKAQELHGELDVPVYKWDVADYAACATGVARVEAEIGPVDVLVNNAGITRDASFAKMTREMWDDVIDVNVTGCFHMARATFGGMVQRGFGRVVNVGSINGQAGRFGQVNYSSSKAALHGFTRALALEGAKSAVTVNCVAPGYVATDMLATVPEPILESIVARIPLRRLGRPQEIAAMIAFLCSEDAAFITGAVIPVNGGQYL